MPGYFDDIKIGEVLNIGTMAVSEQTLKEFCLAFAPFWDWNQGAPDAFTYALWSRLEGEAAKTWPPNKRLGVDALRFVRNPPAGELLRARMTILARDSVGDNRGIIIAQHDVLDEAGRLVFSCLTRSIFSYRPISDS